MALSGKQCSCGICGYEDKMCKHTILPYLCKDRGFGKDKLARTLRNKCMNCKQNVREICSESCDSCTVLKGGK